MEHFVADMIFIDERPERIFSALLEPEDMLVWWDAASVSVDARAGGSYTVEGAGGENGSRLDGRIARLEPPLLLELSPCRTSGGRGPGSSAAATAILFTLRPEDGGAWLLVREESLDGSPAWTERASGARRRWVRATAALKRRVEGI